MIRSVAKGSLLSLIFCLSVACGDKPPPKPPETTPAADEADASASTTDTATDAGTASTDKPTGETTPPPAPKLELPAAAAKIKFKSKKDFDLEIKSDGAVNNAGKPFAKISGMELQDAAGKTQLKVDADGAITTGEGAAYAKFEGDELTSLTGTKYAVGDDGVSSTDDKGKKTAMGKAEGVGSAKRASLLSVAFAMWGTKPPAPKTKPAEGGKKPAGGEKKPGKK